jgi:two-component system, NarL family, capsular synthesis sensor histidine kinase RcsC
MSMVVGEKKILVVDDDEATRFLVSDAFHICETGCTVTTARNGAEAVQVLQSVPVDFILTDLEMPVMNGYQFLSYVKINHSDIPFLAMTGATSVEEYRTCALGVSQCIVKPFNVLELVRRVMNNFNNGHLTHTPSQQQHDVFANSDSS